MNFNRPPRFTKAYKENNQKTLIQDVGFYVS